MTATKKVLCVLRVSTEKQELDSQKESMKVFLCNQGFNEEEIEWLEYQGASAVKRSDKYKEMIDNIKTIISTSDTINSCALWHLNRLGRNDVDLINMKDWFINNGVQVYIKEPSIKLLNDDGKANYAAEMIWNLFAVTVKSDAIEIKEKTLRGKRHNSEIGKYNGGCVRYGYCIDKNNMQVPDEEESPIVRLIFTLYAESNMSTYDLAVELNERGIPYRDNKWNDRAINDILKCTAYIGRLDSDSKSHIHRNYIKIVDDDLFNKCAEKRTKKSNFNTVQKKTSKFVLGNGGLIKCPCCGNNFKIASLATYRCLAATNKKSRKLCNLPICNNGRGIKIEIADIIIRSVAIDKYMDDVREGTKDKKEEIEERAKILNQKKERIEKDIATIDNKIERLNDLYIEGTYTKKQMQEKKDKILSTSQGLADELQSIKLQIEKNESDLKLLNDMSWRTRMTQAIVALKKQKKIDEDVFNGTIKEMVRKYIKVIYVKETTIYDKKCAEMTFEFCDGTHEIYAWYGYKQVLLMYDDILGWRTPVHLMLMSDRFKLIKI